MAAVAGSSPLSLTTIKHYVKMKKDTGTIVVGRGGLKPVLPADIENDLVAWAAAIQRAGWPVDQHDMIENANQVLKLAPESAPSNLGRGWYSGFLRRHPELALRKAQKLSKQRNAVTKECIYKDFYSLLHATVQLRCTAANIYNTDETSFKSMGKSKTVIAIRGSPEVWTTEPNMSYHLTIMAAVAADRTPVPPAFILPSNNVETTVLEKCPVAGALVTTSPKALMTNNLFDKWLIQFGEWKMVYRNAAPAVLILDN